MDAAEVLHRFPAWTAPDRVEPWLHEQLPFVHAGRFDDEARVSFAPLDGHSLPDGQESLRRFANAAILADWACYVANEDRADIPRLQAVIAAYPAGFRVWFCRVAGMYLPAGYTGWYPISATAFAKAHDAPGQLTSRGELWPVELDRQEGAYIWLFNYSIVSPLRRTALSRRLLETYATDLAAIKIKGLAAAVLSEESKRVVARFGMARRGSMTHLGADEDVYAVRF